MDQPEGCVAMGNEDNVYKLVRFILSLSVLN